MFKWAGGKFTNAQLLQLSRNYKNNFVLNSIGYKAFSDIHIFMPFSLYRKHTIWDIYHEVGKNNILESTILHLSWLDDRIDIFESVTLPGLMNSSLNDFTLHILIDDYDNYPFIKQMIRSRVSDLMAKCHFKYVFHEIGLFPHEEPYDSYPEILVPVIRSILKESDKSNESMSLIRLDSDDTIMPEFLSIADEISYSFYHSTNTLLDSILIDFPFGIQYISKSCSSYLTLWPENNFTVQLISKSQLQKNYLPFQYAHDEIPNDIERVVISTAQPLWIQGIHSTNLMNALFPWSKLHKNNLSIAMLLNSFA